MFIDAAESSVKWRDGFPLRSFQGQSWDTEGAIHESGIITTGQHWLPYVPIWPGFTVNTIFYATFLWLLACGLLGVRWLVRVRRGLCPGCAYPRGGSDVCSECGKAMRERANVTA